MNTTVPRVLVSRISTIRGISSTARLLAVEKVERISENISFRPSQRISEDTARRPIVLIYAWLVAKSRHIHKYGDFYLGKGFDVLHIKVSPGQLLWPTRVQGVTQQVVDFITAPSRRAQPVLVHGFSVGGYVYSETLVQLTRDPAMTNDMAQRVKGQIFDSPVDMEGVPRGISKAVSTSAATQFVIKSSIDSYLSVFNNQVTRHYTHGSKTFHSNPLRTPSLMLYSHADVVGTVGPIEVLANNWRKLGVPVHTKVWQDTPHVSHFIRDPIGYTAAVNDFLGVIGLADKEEAVERAQVVTQP